LFQPVAAMKRRRALLVCAALAFALISARARAQAAPALAFPPPLVSANTERSFPGLWEPLEAGAVLVRATDPSAIWYNPAGIVTEERSGLNANAPGYQFTAYWGSSDNRPATGSALRGLPNTTDAMARVIASSKLPAPVVPATQAVPLQESGRRPARTLPYALAVHENATGNGELGLKLDFVNDGAAAAVFSVCAVGAAVGPWFYTVGAGQRLSDRMSGLAVDKPYAVAVHGPNGFLREFSGDPASALKPEVVVAQTPDGATLLVKLTNLGTAACTLTLRPLAYRKASALQVPLKPGASHTVRYPVAGTDHWYDFVVEEPSSSYARRFAGHVETGRPSWSDPAIGTLA